MKAAPPEPEEDEDDIQEVVPVKAEPVMPAPAAAKPDLGTMAMYEDGGGDVGGGMLLEEGSYDENYPDYDQEEEYTEQNYLIPGQDGSTGREQKEIGNPTQGWILEQI